LVLVVDDDTTLRRVAERTLIKLGYRVVPAADGEEALAAHARHADGIRVVLSDVEMPKVGGVELLRRLRESGSDAGFILCSGYTDGEIESPSGAEPFLTLAKPWSREELSAAVRQALGAA
jgi:CheY-like chemotaxis protein